MNLIAVLKQGPAFAPDEKQFAPDKGISCWDYKSSPPCSASYHVYVCRKLTKDEIEQYRRMARVECRSQHPHHQPKIIL